MKLKLEARRKIFIGKIIAIEKEKLERTSSG
jgi:hypothetical protein